MIAGVPLVNPQKRRLEKLRKALDAASQDGRDAMLAALAPAIDALSEDRANALAMIRALDQGPLPPDDVANVFGRILDLYGDDEEIPVLLGATIESARDLDDLNAAPTGHPLFSTLLAKLAEQAVAASYPEEEKFIQDALGTTARMMGRQKDDTAERAFKRLVELDPETPFPHYGLGLFYKTRGRFAEGMAANQRAIDLAGDKASDAMKWNLGICATGAGEGQVALEVWRAMGNTLDIGHLDLPDGGYHSCKVRLAERPLAERSAESDDPGMEENIWIERLSPCHGIVRSVLFQEDLGVDFGDTVLFDGAPITYNRYGDSEVAVFPHLATLAKGNHHIYLFAATQLESGVVETVNERLENAAYIYSHTENFYTLCACCMAKGDTDHAQERREHKVIRGRIAIPPDITAADALARIDAAYAAIEGARLFAPDLAQAAGDEDRARMEMPRFLELTEED